MATTTIKMGKRGTLVLPAKLRKQFGLEDGSFAGLLHRSRKMVRFGIFGLLLFMNRSHGLPEEKTAYFILINSMTKEEWDRNLPHVLEMGVDPTRIKGLEPSHRDTLLTDAEWEARSMKRHKEQRSA